MKPKKILVTGAAGFIGMHTAKYLLQRGDIVLGIDNINEYYDQNLKQARLMQLYAYPNFKFIKMDIADRQLMADLFKNEKFVTSNNDFKLIYSLFNHVKDFN